GALGPRAACGAERHRLGLQVYTRGQVLLLELLLHLFHGGLYLRRRQFGFNVRRAIKAERTLGVPAGTANPMRALGTLPEVWLRLLGCLAEGLVMRRPLDRALNLITRRAGLPQDPAEKASRGMKRAGRHARGRGLKFAHEAVAAPIAEKFKLKTFVGRVVSMVPGELDQGHDGRISRGT